MAHYLDCDMCGAPTRVGSIGTLRVTCAQCIVETWEPPKEVIKKEVGYPKGWRFMKEFVHTNGKVYYKGIEQESLFGTLDPTVIELKKKLSKFEIQEQRSKAVLEIVELKKQLKKETRKTIIKKLEVRIKKLQKQI